MKSVGLREFKNRAAELLRKKDILLIQRHGRDIGFFVPLEDVQALPIELRIELFRRATDEIGTAARKRGMTEAKLLRYSRSLKTRPRRGH